nr:hypothetical protein [Tanacetum cinerariifolium]
MPSLFADNHNVVAILEKSDASKGFAQIIDFLSGNYIHYALTVSPHIYISCIKQFWNTAVVKRSGDVTRLQAIVDKKKIVISEDVIREILQLDDAEGVVPAQDDVDHENVTEEIADDVAQPTSPLPPSPIIPSLPPHQSPRPFPSQAAEGSSILVQQVLDKCFALILRVEGLESANTAQQLEILKLKARVKKLERLNKVKSSKLRHLKKVGTSQRIESSEDEENVFNQGRMSVDINEGIELVDDQEKDAQVKGRQADTQAKIYNIDLDHTSKVVAVSTPISAAKPAAKPKVLKIVPAAPTTFSAKDKGKGILVEDPKPMKKKDQIAMDAEYARKLREEEESHVQAKDVQANDAPAKGIQYIKRYHGYKKKPQSESEVRKNMIAYLKNTKGFKMAFFKGKTYD